MVQDIAGITLEETIDDFNGLPRFVRIGVAS
jgi:hypothetical protein